MPIAGTTGTEFLFALGAIDTAGMGWGFGEVCSTGTNMADGVATRFGTPGSIGVQSHLCVRYTNVNYASKCTLGQKTTFYPEIP